MVCYHRMRVGQGLVLVRLLRVFSILLLEIVDPRGVVLSHDINLALVVTLQILNSRAVVGLDSGETRVDLSIIATEPHGENDDTHDETGRETTELNENIGAARRRVLLVVYDSSVTHFATPTILKNQLAAFELAAMVKNIWRTTRMMSMT